MARKNFDRSQITDIRLRRILRKRKRKKALIRIAVRLGVIILIFLLSVTLLVFALKKTLLKPESPKAVVRGTVFVDPDRKSVV